MASDIKDIAHSVDAPAVMKLLPARPRVQRGIGAVAVGCAIGGRKDAGLLVVPDRLRGQTVPARQVNRPEPSTVLKVSSHGPDGIAEKFQPKVQRYR